MMHKNDFKKLFREAFTLNTEWIDWFMDSVFDENDMLDIEIDNKLVSALLMSSYPFAYQGAELLSAYISCVATAKSERGKGYMSTLMLKALIASAERGDAFATLIPANKHLYFFYDAFGFSTVFYIDEQRYTSLHTFASSPDFYETEPDFDTFRRLEALRPCGVRHDRKRFSQIMDDIRLDEGLTVAVTDGKGEDAIAFVENGNEAKVLDLLATSETAAENVLASIRKRVGEKSVIILGLPSEAASDSSFKGARLRSRGMVRIINSEVVLCTLAAANPSLHQTVRIHDPILRKNNATFIISGGQCKRSDSKPAHLDLDVNIDVLGRLLFSAPSIGDVFGIPTRRPFISLMLD